MQQWENPVIYSETFVEEISTIFLLHLIQFFIIIIVALRQQEERRK